MALALCGCRSPAPWAGAGAPASGTARPTILPFEPRSTVPVRSTPTLQPSPQPLSPDGPAGLPTVISAPAAIPLPRLCLMPAFADVLAQMPGCTHYEIELDIDPDGAQVTGSQVIDYTNSERESLDDILLRLFPNAPHYGGTMTVTHPMINGQAVTGALELQSTALRIPLATPLAAGGRITISMDFDVSVPRTRAVGYGLFSYVDGVMALPNVYPMIPAHDDEGWNAKIAPDYADDVHADIAAYSVRITAPPAMNLIASGACNNRGAGVWQCDASPMRDFTIVLSTKFRRLARTVRGVVVNSYFYEGAQQNGQLALDVAVDAVRAFTEYFGDYPLF